LKLACCIVFERALVALFAILIATISIKAMEIRAPREGGNITILVLGDGTCPSHKYYLCLKYGWIRAFIWCYCSGLYYVVLIFKCSRLCLEI